MGQHTEIQWCDSTVNSTTGCDGCELWGLIGRDPPVYGGVCYSGPIHEQRLAKSLPALYAPNFTEVRMAPGRMAKAAAWSDMTGKDRPGKPWLDKMPRVIFPGDMSDMLSKAVTFDYIKAELIDVALSPKGRRHIWMVLTKRPGRLVNFESWLQETFGIPWPENVWCGTSVTSRATLKRLDKLAMMFRPVVKFVSAEPLWEEVDLSPWLAPEMRDDDDKAPFQLAIIGGQSRQKGQETKPFDLAWARKLIGQCREANVHAFLKQLGSDPYDSAGPGHGYCAANIVGPLRDGHGGDWSEWPEDLRVREFPVPLGTPAHFPSGDR